MSCQSEAFNVQSFSPLFDTLYKIITCLFISELVIKISFGRVTNPHSIKCMYFIVLFQIFKKSIKSHGIPSKTMKQHNMGQFGVLVISINFMNMVYFINSDSSIIDFLSKLKGRELQSIVQYLYRFLIIHHLFFKNLGILRKGQLFLIDHLIIVNKWIILNI